MVTNEGSRLGSLPCHYYLSVFFVSARPLYCTQNLVFEGAACLHPLKQFIDHFRKIHLKSLVAESVSRNCIIYKVLFFVTHKLSVGKCSCGVLQAICCYSSSVYFCGLNLNECLNISKVFSLGPKVP